MGHYAHTRMSDAAANTDAPAVVTWPNYSEGDHSRGDSLSISAGTGITGHIHPSTPQVHIQITTPDQPAPGDIWIHRDRSKMIERTDGTGPFLVSLHDGSSWIPISRA